MRAGIPPVSVGTDGFRKPYSQILAGRIRLDLLNTTVSVGTGGFQEAFLEDLERKTLILLHIGDHAEVLSVVILLDAAADVFG